MGCGIQESLIGGERGVKLVLLILGGSGKEQQNSDVKDACDVWG